MVIMAIYLLKETVIMAIHLLKAIVIMAIYLLKAMVIMAIYLLKAMVIMGIDFLQRIFGPNCYFRLRSQIPLYLSVRPFGIVHTR